MVVRTVIKQCSEGVKRRSNGCQMVVRRQLSGGQATVKIIVKLWLKVTRHSHATHGNRAPKKTRQPMAAPIGGRHRGQSATGPTRAGPHPTAHPSPPPPALVRPLPLLRPPPPPLRQRRRRASAASRRRGRHGGCAGHARKPLAARAAPARSTAAPTPGGPRGARRRGGTCGVGGDVTGAVLAKPRALARAGMGRATSMGGGAAEGGGREGGAEERG
jgi:hypothetical protein